MSEQGAYAAAGVDIAAGERAVELMKHWVETTRRSEVLTGLGGFTGLFDASRLKTMSHPVLATSTDGVGTKVAIAQAMDVHDTIGFDLVGMVVDDLVVCGAEPLFLLDYVAANRIDVSQVAELVEGAAEVCRAAGCVLLGGETAELPDVYRGEELDFAGTCVGVVERDRLVDGSRVEAGDALIGFPSAGVHANGFTLVRRLLERDDYDGDDLLAPTRLYLEEARALRGRAKAFAHVTGGGVLGNLSRVIPDGLHADLDWDAWQRPPVFEWLARHVDEEELRRVFNVGIGWCAVVDEAQPGELVIGRIG